MVKSLSKMNSLLNIGAMNKRPLLDKNLPKNLNEASNELKSALSAFEEVIDNEKSWSLRADARRRITLYYQTQVSLQETGSEPLGLGPSSPVENGNLLACLPG